MHRDISWPGAEGRFCLMFKHKRNQSGYECMATEATRSWKGYSQTNSHQCNWCRYVEWQSHTPASRGSTASHSDGGWINKKGKKPPVVLPDRVSRFCIHRDGPPPPTPPLATKSIQTVRPLDRFVGQFALRFRWGTGLLTLCSL